MPQALMCRKTSVEAPLRKTNAVIINDIITFHSRAAWYCRALDPTAKLHWTYDRLMI